jgi:hypothetical protein
MIKFLGYWSSLRKVENNIEKRVNPLGGGAACQEQKWNTILYFRIKTTGFLVETNFYFA